MSIIILVVHHVMWWYAYDVGASDGGDGIDEVCVV